MTSSKIFIEKELSTNIALLGEGRINQRPVRGLCPVLFQVPGGSPSSSPQSQPDPASSSLGFRVSQTLRCSQLSPRGCCGLLQGSSSLSVPVDFPTGQGASQGRVLLLLCCSLPQGTGPTPISFFSTWFCEDYLCISDCKIFCQSSVCILWGFLIQM